ncbi:MAG TPA: PAS domain-containing protein, partial [Chthoniobacterales bacterium]|nr:PAS domain-containing protein [Chthoniobacterales bacterium]
RPSSEAESTIRKTEERYRALVENFPGGSMTVFDRDFRILFIGGDDAKNYGPPEKYVGKLLREIAPAETCEIVEPNVRLAFEGQKVIYETPYKGGTRYRATATPIFSKEGAIIEVLVVAANITEQERARAALRESEERFRLLAEVTNDAIWDWDLVTNQLWWNEGFENLFGYSREEIEKTIDSWYNRVHPAERGRVIAGIHRVIDEGGTTWSDEYRFLCKNGSYAYVLDRGQVIRNGAGKAVRMVGGMRDLTERKRVEAAAQAFPAELLRAQDEERRRIARELHDSTAQELAVVAMNLGRLEEWIEGRDAWAENLLADSLAVLAQGNRDLRTLAHLLHPPMLEELGLIGALRDYVEGFSARSGIQVDLEAPQDFDRCSSEIETALFRVVQESLSNVHRHSGSKVALVKLACDRDVVELTIVDRGKGLPEGLLIGTAEKARVGVGISGMRQRVSQLMGRLEIASNRHGTTVHAVLPFCPETS